MVGTSSPAQHTQLIQQQARVAYQRRTMEHWGHHPHTSVAETCTPVRHMDTWMASASSWRGVRPDDHEPCAAKELMLKKIFVGNLAFDATEHDLEETFATYGTVESVAVVTDRETGRPRGFGFVEMADDNEASAAITGLNGTDLHGRTLTVNEARPRADRGGGGGRRGGGGGGGRGQRW